MATGKKFYWIKLRKDFMTSDTVDFLMGQKNGAEYVVLYQMLCLMCINTDGKLSTKIGEIIIPFDADKIQRDCKYFSRDTIVIALELFRKLGLIYEQNEIGMVISGFECLIGSETDYARQKRIQRQCGQIQGQLMDNSMDNVHDNVSEVSTQSKSKEKETRVRDQSKEKETREKNLKKDNSITVSKDTVCQTDVRRIMETWNTLQNYGVKPIFKISSGSKRYRSLVARIKQYSIADVLKAIEKIKCSDFLQGKKGNGWTITFDWFVLPNNFPKVLEGNYDNQTVREGEGFYQGSQQPSQLDYLLESIRKDEENDTTGS